MNLRHFQQPALQGARNLYNKLGLRHPHARTKQEIQKHEYLKTGLRSLIRLRIVESLTHISLINLLPLVIRRLSSSEKRHELALVKRRHEELERQYQVSIRLKEQENRLKFEQSQLELEQSAESHKKQLIEMEMKAFELEDSSSEVSEKVAESNSTGVSQPISKVATDRTNDWVDSVSSQAPPDVASAPGLLAFTPVPISLEQTTSANLAHAIPPVMVKTLSTQH